MNKYKIIALYGKSASGKDTFLKIALKCFKNFHKIIIIKWKMLKFVI